MDQIPSYDTMLVNSADRLSGIPSNCIVPLNPPLQMGDVEEIVFQSFIWPVSNADGIINENYNAVPFQEDSGPPVVVHLPRFNPSTSYLDGASQVLGAATKLMTAASPNGYTYNYNNGIIGPALSGSFTFFIYITNGTGQFKFLWQSGPALGLGAASTYISLAMGYGVPGPTITDTPLANTHQIPSNIDLQGPGGLVISINAPTGLPNETAYTSDGQPGCWVAPVSIELFSIGENLNNSIYAGRMDTRLRAIGTIPALGVVLHPTHTYPYYALTTLSDWTMVLLIKRAPKDGRKTARNRPF